MPYLDQRVQTLSAYTLEIPNKKLLQKEGGHGKWDVLACLASQTPGVCCSLVFSAWHRTVWTYCSRE